MTTNSEQLLMNVGLYSLLPGRVGLNGVNRANGPDLSHWEKSYDPNKAVYRADFGITKATEGTTWVDPSLQPIWNGVKQLPITGLYHYQRSQVGWREQINHFLSVSMGLLPDFLALDIEGINNVLDVSFFKNCFNAFQYLRERSLLKTVLYTNPNIFQNYLYPIWTKYYGKEGERLAMESPLWIAQYWTIRSPYKNPGMPKQRKTWDIWQWTDKGVSKDWGGGAEGIDLNVFNGTAEDMLLWVRSQESSDNKPELELWRATVITNERRNVRIAPNTDKSSLTKNRLVLGDIVSGILETHGSYVWIKITEANNSELIGKWVAVSRKYGENYLKLEKIKP